MPIRQILARRLVLLLPLLLGVLFCTFMLVRISGQDPVAMIAGPTATAQEIALVRSSLSLDQPLWIQFGTYLTNVLRGDLGRSWISNRPVLEDLVTRIPATLELLLPGVLLGALVGIPVGVRAAYRPNRAFDQVSRVLSLLGFSVPTYWLGLMSLFVFFYLLEWAPPGMGRISLMLTPPPTVTGSYLIDAVIAGDWEAARSAAAQLVLPVLCVAVIAAAPIIKQCRAIVLDVLGSDYVRYARAQGLPASWIRRIALRNSATSLITFVATELAALVGTVSLIEYVFSWGGIGQYGLSAIIAGDFTAVQGYVLMLALFSMLIFLLVDVLVLILEPRAGVAA